MRRFSTTFQQRTWLLVSDWLKLRRSNNFVKKRGEKTNKQTKTIFVFNHLELDSVNITKVKDLIEYIYIFKLPVTAQRNELTVELKGAPLINYITCF